MKNKDKYCRRYSCSKKQYVCVFIIPKERYVVLRKAGGPSNISVMASSKDQRPSKSVILSFQVI